MVGKALLNLDEIARTLAPDFDPNAAIRAQSVDIMRRKFQSSLSPSRVFTSILEAKETLEELPRRVNTILERYLRQLPPPLKLGDFTLSF